MKGAFLSALDAADVTLCTGDYLSVTAKPSLAIAAANGVRRSKQEHFILTLLGTLKKKTFPGEVMIRCKRR